MSNTLSDRQVDQYRQDGFIVLRGFFADDEVSALRDAARHDQQLDNHAIARADGEGTPVRLALWNHPGDNIYGMFARCEEMVGAVRQVLGDEPYHYHSKMIMKEPRVGGAWEWHQDYGYWYQNGVLTPNLASVMIAVDRATKENGCLQVIKGSHHIGRIEHNQTGDQAGADSERVEVALDRYELVYCELDPGDIVMFHSNTLHRSDANRSDNPRWTMICCYNARSNNPFQQSHHPSYTPIDTVPRSAIIEASRQGKTTSNADAWLAQKDDKSATSLPQ